MFPTPHIERCKQIIATMNNSPAGEFLETFLRVFRSACIIPERFIINAAIMIVLVSFLFMISGCVYYKVSTKDSFDTENVLGELVNERYPSKIYHRDYYTEKKLISKLFREHNFYAIDSNGRWLMESLVLSNDTIFCKSTFSPIPPDSIKSDENRKSMRYSKNREAYFTERINLYVETINFIDSGRTYFPVSSITKYDLYSKDKGKSIVVPILLGAAIGAGTLLLMVAIFGGMNMGN